MDDTSQKLINLDVFRATNERLKIYIDDEIINAPSKVVIDSMLSSTSKNPVENRIITAEFDKYISKNGTNEINGNLEFADAGVGNFRGIGGTVGTNDYWRIAGGATNRDKGFLEIATSDNGNEPIYVRQYAADSKFNKLLRSATLLDESGNTIFPGQLTTNGALFTGDVTISSSSSPVLKVDNTSNGDAALILARGERADWRILNAGGTLSFQNNWTSSKTDYFSTLTLNYNTGNAIFKGSVTSPSFIGALSGNATSATSAVKAQTADKWTTARTLSLSGAIAGSVSIDGTGNVNVITSEADLSFKRMGHIDATTDWNTLITPGCYKIQMANWGDSSTMHSPNEYGALYSFGLLLVFKSAVAVEGRVVQIYLPHKSTNDASSLILTRMRNNDIWQSWSPLFKGISKSYIGLGNVNNTADSAKSVASAAKWTTARSFTIGNTAKNVNGTANMAWSLSEIGAAPSSGSTNINKLARTVTLGTGGPATILQDNGTYRQKIDILDNATTEDGVFEFSQSSDSGASWKNLMTINDDGNIIASKFTGSFVGNLLGNASSSAKLQTTRSINGTNFDGTSNITTSKWGMSRTVSCSGAATARENLDGSENKNFVLLRRGASVGQSVTVTTNKPWYKFASTTLTSTYTDRAISFKVSSDYGITSRANGILHARIRTNGSGNYETAEFYWEYANDAISTNDFVMTYNTTGNPTICELWCRCPNSHVGYHFAVIGENSRNARSDDLWTLYNTWSDGSAASYTTGENHAFRTSILLTIKNSISGNAASATKATQDGNGNVITNKYVTLDTTQNISGQKTFTGLSLFTNTTDAGSASSGAVVISGGLGVSKQIVTNGKLFVGHGTASNAIIYLNNKQALKGTDTWLRINDSQAFVSGTYFGNGILRTDGILQVGNNGSTLSASNSAVIIKKETTFTSNVSITKNTPSTSVASGALTVTGGIGTSGTISAMKAQLGDKWRITINPETESLEMTYYG